ncbi:MAG: CehA/McbA family metallohydrolase [Bacteroidota bacterium]
MKAFVLLIIAIFMATTAIAQPAVGGFNVYYGSLHNHSNVSDGQGTPDEAYSYAKNVAQLDFFGLSDHANLMNAAEWLLIKTTANLYNEDSVFAAFYGFEWTTYFSYGHVNVVNTEDYCSNNSPTNTFGGLINWLNARNGAAFFNHPGWDIFAFNEFNHFTDPPCSKFVGMELWNDHDGFSKYYYNNGYYNGDGNKGYFDEALIRHWKIGAAGGDDNHTATWGTATPFRMGVLAPAKTRSDIFEALLARRFFSTLDQNLVLSFRINGNEMGSTIAGGTWNGVIETFDPDNELIVNIDLLKNGNVIQTWTPGITHPVVTTSIACADGDYFYTRVREADGDEAISSPVFISGTAQPPQIAIINPLGGAVFTQGSVVPLLADASDTDGDITDVEFYCDGDLIGSDDFPPYTLNWTAVNPGDVIFTAKASDDTGLFTVSEGILVTIEPFIPELAVSPLNQDVSFVSGSTGFNITSNTAWTAVSNQEWCPVNTAGSGDGTITVEYGENLMEEARLAEITITVAGLPPVIVTITQAGVINKLLNLNVLFEGLYNGNGMMHPALDETGTPHWGAEVADMITIELHEVSNYSEIVYTIQDVALLTDGSATITIPAIYGGSYYITVKHRNSIETVSAVPVSFSQDIVSYGFMLDSQVYGSNLALMPDGWRALFGGDVLPDGSIDTGDMTPVDNDSRNFQGGYLNSDVNGDGTVDTADMTIVDNNAAHFVSVIRP